MRRGRTRPPGPPRRGGGYATSALLALGAVHGACSEPCCTLDSLPITLGRGPSGELTVLVSDAPGQAARPAVFDTGSSITVWRAESGTAPFVQKRQVRLHGQPGPAEAPVRAAFSNVETVVATTGTLAAGEPPPAAIIGGDLLVGFSVAVDFVAPSVTFWSRQGASNGFLSLTGRAVLSINRRGGGELGLFNPVQPLDFGGQAPHRIPASRLVLRACAAPDSFLRDDPLPAKCCPGDEKTVARGTSLSLLISTGVGPVVLGQAAWGRVRARLEPAPAEEMRPLFVAGSPRPIAARWTNISRLALVDHSTDTSSNPGPCVELGRARRLEQVAWRQSQNQTMAACALPCDLSPGSGDAQTGAHALDGAGYVELGGNIDVAIIADTEPFLQAARAEIRPEGPEIAGFLGAAALKNARVELDYVSQPARAIFSCAGDAPATACRAVGACPRLPDSNATHVCFGLPRHGLPRMCNNPNSCGSP